MSVSLNCKNLIDNKESLKTAFRNIIDKNGGSTVSTHKIVEQIIFNNDKNINSNYVNPQLSIIQASTQISINKTLCETLKFLKQNANKKTIKQVIFGELWNILETTNASSENNPYNGELIEFTINTNAKNIFAS